MSQENKRGRGRPETDDRSTLQNAADMMAEDTTLNPTSAFRRLGVADPSAIRRLQVKWKASSADFMAAAHDRKAERNKILQPQPMPVGASGRPAARFDIDPEYLGGMRTSVRSIMESPSVQRALEEQARIQRMLKPHGDIANILKPYNEIAKALKPFEEIRKTMEPMNRLREIQQLSNPFGRFRR